MLKKTLFLYCFLILLSSCGEKEKPLIVDDGLALYVDRFFEEAALRNADVSDKNLEVVFADLSADGVCGFGHFRYRGTDLRKVEIFQDIFCWDLQSDLGKESLMFHELGHAVLRKSHSNATFPNGLPSSIMCCLLYTSPSPRDRTRSRMPSSA